MPEEPIEPEFSPMKHFDMPWYGKLYDMVTPGQGVADAGNVWNTMVDFYNTRKGGEVSADEWDYRKRLFDATPDYGYGDTNAGFVGLGRTWANIGANMAEGKTNTDKFHESNRKTDFAGQRELKARYMGGSNWEDWIDHDDRFYEESEYKPSVSEDPNATYLKPKDMLDLDQDQFNLLKTAINEVGGNSFDIQEYLNVNVNKDIQNPGGIKPFDLYRHELGTYTLGITPEGNISAYDLWDLDPPQLKDRGLDIDKFFKPPEIYWQWQDPSTVKTVTNEQKESQDYVYDRPDLKLMDGPPITKKEEIKTLSEGGETGPGLTTPPGVPDVKLPTNEEMGLEISNTYLNFLDNFNENLYLSDLFVYKNKKSLLLQDRLQNDDFLADEDGIKLAEDVGFYDMLKEKPYYNKLPFKDSLLKWLPDLQTMSDMGETMFEKTFNKGAAQFNEATSNVKLKPGKKSFNIGTKDSIPIGSNIGIGGNATISPGGKQKIKPTFTITKKFN